MRFLTSPFSGPHLLPSDWDSLSRSERPGKGSMGVFPLSLALALLLLLAFLLASLVHCSNTGLNSLDLALVVGPLSP